MYFCVNLNLPTIIAGDFNTLDQPDIDRSSPGSPSEKNKALTSLCKVWVDYESPPVRKFVLKVYGPQTYKVENHCSRPLSSA